jgi:hypothetical protein
MLWSGIDRNIFASADLALHIALTFSSGIRPNAGGANMSSNTVKNKKARFIRTLMQLGPSTENLLVGIAVPKKDMGYHSPKSEARYRWLSSSIGGGLTLRPLLPVCPCERMRWMAPAHGI